MDKVNLNKILAKIHNKLLNLIINKFRLLLIKQRNKNKLI